jgi:uncharacterized membrane protein
MRIIKSFGKALFGVISWPFAALAGALLSLIAILFFAIIVVLYPLFFSTIDFQDLKELGKEQE